MRRALAALAITAAAAVLAAAPSLARHPVAGEEPCPDYTTEGHFHTNDDTIAESFVLAAEGVYELLDRLDQANPPKGIAAAALAATQTAALTVQGLNAVADACYEPNHFQLQDELMKMTMQANLAAPATSSPDIQFLMPNGERPEDDGPGHAGLGHVDIHDETFPGYIDRERDDNPGEIEGWDVLGTKTMVRGVIDAMLLTDQCTCTAAESSYNQAVSSMQAGRYKDAYKQFRQAYVYAFSN